MVCFFFRFMLIGELSNLRGTTSSIHKIDLEIHHEHQYLEVKIKAPRIVTWRSPLSLGKGLRDLWPVAENLAM